MADVPGPARSALTGGEQYLGVGQFAPLFVFGAPDEVVGVFDSLHDSELAVALTSAQHVVDHRNHRGTAEAAGGDQDILAFGFSQRPAAAERPAYADTISDFQFSQGIGHPANGADGVVVHVLILRIGDDGDRYLTDAVEIEHVELSRSEAEIGMHCRIGEAQTQGEYCRGFLDALDDLRLIGLTQFAHGLPPASVPNKACTSSVMSIPTGHQVMQRPQPTQPERPYCSFQLPTL